MILGRFIPRARARGHARTLRARALYGMADPGNMWYPVGTLLMGWGALGQGPSAPHSPAGAVHSPCSTVAAAVEAPAAAQGFDGQSHSPYIPGPSWEGPSQGPS